ncbi:POLAR LOCALIZATION DURING ASYMMETRIC DIVISION AND REDISTRIBUTION protein [Zostera marina]|uniref:POLAR LOCALIZATION DURING ASYMMETRIC DIVISION AND REDISTRIBUTION protein n=1 Tax=Zostera marina TaxID=29655 RepID=A0A0K9PT19_ZOSMR|nr:POLAR LOCALIZATION DURING ASYMMETRIC DIVISION AND REDISTRIBUTION protein [Zostera marina]
MELFPQNNKDGAGGLRIIDILQESDHSDDTSNIGSFKSNSPVKSAVSHWLTWMKNRKEDRQKQKNECLKRQGRGSGFFKSVLNGKTPPSPPPPPAASVNSNSEQQIQMGNGAEFDKPTFHIGVGVGLIYLLAKTSHEFKKMTELRKEMEIMVKETRESFARRHGNGNAEADVMESTHFSDSSSDKISYNNVSFQACDENNDHKNQLENELRSELLQLQHNLDITKRVEVPNYDNTDSEKEEDYNEMEGEWEQNNGVCPFELERRLHELLEERQEHQIIELQFDLENAERELQERDREIYWLKNASTLLRNDSTKSC